MKKITLLLLMTVSGILIIASCKKKDSEPESEATPSPAPSACAPTTVAVNADITTAQTWDACHIYVITSSQISVTSTLTIQPGTVIKFKDNVSDNAILVSNAGQITAEGTVAKPIIFTSFKDDTYGGDSNGDGSGSGPSRFDWGGIIINNNNCVFRNCGFYYGGKGPGGVTGQPSLEFSSYYGTVDQCTFALCGGEPTNTGYGVVDARSSESPNMKITNNVFYGCIKPLFLSPHISLDNSNTFHNPANANVKNQLNGVFFTSTSNEPTTDVSWLETEVPFVITGSTFFGDGKKLILAPDVIIKVTLSPAAGFNKIAIKEGKSFIENNSASGVFFTSYLDDAHGGDTNGDNELTVPAKGDWYGIQDISAVITTSNNCYPWANILYAKNP